MITILRMAGRFFKTWFLSSPAHDAFIAASTSTIKEEPSVPEGEPESVRSIAENIDDDATMAIDESTGQERRRNRVPSESRAIDSSTFSNLVKEPEADNERMSRVRKFDDETGG